MGELVAGRPALRLNVAVSLPLDLVSIMSLLYRAVPGSGLDPWLVQTRRSLPPELLADLDLLHGFSGRMLYYAEEPVMRFGPLLPEHRDAGFDELMAFLQALPPQAYRDMAVHALERVHRDLHSGRPAPPLDDAVAWRAFLAPALTTADAGAALALIEHPAALKERTLRMMRGTWEQVYRDEYAARLPVLREAARLARPAEGRGFGLAFTDLTGNRLPSPLVSELGNVECVTFCPSYHLGGFVSYIRYPPDLVIFFGATELIARTSERGQDQPTPAALPVAAPENGRLADETLLEALRAMADPNRLRILDLLGDGELYAQEVVGRLGIAQSAVSRHLALLERAGLVRVRPRGGMKYYALDERRLAAVADAIRARGHD